MPRKNIQAIEPQDLVLALKSTIRKVLETDFIYETYLSGGKIRPLDGDTKKGITAPLLEIGVNIFLLEHTADQLGSDQERQSRDLCNELNRWIFRYLSDKQIIQIKNSVRQRRIREKNPDRIRSRLKK